ncbi:activity-regulated cytoskeleton associated protein 1-like [Sitophilus oryzae]|uniref:Activity-regulated cytoskeleton associated protein 1-like n=1 Tax=Sitophilus oryzae TaxID=7048 RepID=A0A6J2XIQ3_SITOR|nr:activity-regulated cytoskeleton associated protein 1-like [Sitophilus oryzae]
MDAIPGPSNSMPPGRRSPNDIETFKDCSRVSDANALRGLSMLLDDFAATWWYGVKDTVATWETALDLLRLTFGPRKLAYLVCREIFSNEQDIRTPSDVFICQSRSLLAQLPANTLTESTQIDMIYGLLHKRIREKVPRDKVPTFNELLKECGMVEETFVDHFDIRPL